MLQLDKYIRKRFETIQLILEKPRKQFSISTFHQLRVEIKKLNATFELINNCIPKFKRAKTFKPFRILFKQAGKIRELQVEEALLNNCIDNELPFSVKQHIQNEKKAERAAFFRNMETLSAASLEKAARKVMPFVQKLNGPEVNRFLSRKHSRIKKLLANPNIKTIEIHELRKELKKYTYMFKCLHDGKAAKVQLSNTDQFMDLLGKWHDCQSVIDHLKKVKSIGHFSKIETGHIDSIITVLSADLRAHFRQIKISLHTSELNDGESTALAVNY